MKFSEIKETPYCRLCQETFSTRTALCYHDCPSFDTDEGGLQ